MNKAVVMVAIAVVAAVGISAFALMSGDSSEVTPVVQEPAGQLARLVSARSKQLEKSN